jgi:hypothetical protein
VVHRHDRGRVRRDRQRRVEPAQPLAAELAAILARKRAVDDHQAELTEVDRILNRLPSCARNVEVAVERVAVVVVAREDVRRRLDACEQGAHLLVLRVGGVLGEVAGDENRVGPSVEGVHRLDGRLEPRDRVDAVPRRADVQVAQLHEDERPAHLSKIRGSRRQAGARSRRGVRHAP